MPQLVPFYFFNEVIFTSVTLLVLIYLLSVYLLPKLLCKYTARVFLSKI